MDNKLVYNMKKLSFHFVENATVLSEVDLKIESSSFYGIIGANGCGKTTLLMLMLGYYSQNNGEVIFKDIPISQYSKKDLSKEIALIPQDFNTNFDYSVEEVIMMGRYPYISRFSLPANDDYKKVDNIIGELDIESLRKRSVTDLSGGEKQRVIFARALAQDTSVILLDEATSNMDIRHSLQALDIISEKVKMGKTAIGVFHDINLASMYCDKLIFMKKSKVVDSGNTYDVLNESNINKAFAIESKIIEINSSKHIIFNRKKY